MTARREPAIGRLALRLFDETFPGPSWRAWRAFVVALFGAEATREESATIVECTGRTQPPTGRASEAWVIAGRRGGKSRLAAFLAVCFACLPKHRLAPGERGVVMVLAADRKQARVVFSYVAALLRQHAMLTSLIERETTSEIHLSNRVSIEIYTASSRAVRGVSIIAAIADEVAFWPKDEAADPDTEVMNAIRPAMATTRGMLVAISTPYAPTGELHKAHDRHFGRDGSDVLVWQASTRVMNPSIDQAIVDRAMADDPSAAAAEWLAQFRSDLESLFSRDSLAAVVASGRRELPPVEGTAYVAFVDPSGGSSDSMTLAIAHRSATAGPVLDVVREVKPPFSPDAVVAQFVEDLKRYHVRTVTGDAYSGEWVRAAFKTRGIDYVVAENTRSELYLELLPMVNAGTIELLDDERLIGQLTALERRIGRSGRDSVDHRPGLHDDRANAVAGACVLAQRATGRFEFPASFTSCLVYDPARKWPQCALFGGGHTPSDPHCFQHCSGLRVAWPAYRAHADGQSFPMFVRTRFAQNAATNDFAWRHWRAAFVLPRLGL